MSPLSTTTRIRTQCLKSLICLKNKVQGWEEQLEYTISTCLTTVPCPIRGWVAEITRRIIMGYGGGSQHKGMPVLLPKTTEQLTTQNCSCSMFSLPETICSSSREGWELNNNNNNGW